MNSNPSNQARKYIEPYAKALIPVSGKSIAKIEAYGGMEEVCRGILEGQTVQELADTIGIPRSDLTIWHMNLADPRYEAAMRASAEACLDRAEEVLRTADTSGMASVMIARERAALWRHRAAVRDCRYSPKASVDFSPPPEQRQIPSFVINVLPSPTRREELVESSPDLHDPD